MTNVTPFDIFIIHCVFTNAFLGKDFINYKFDNFTPKDSSFLLRVANTVIDENELSLKAKVVGLPYRCVLQITEK